MIGAVLSARSAAATRGGALPLDAFLDGYRLGLLVSAALVAVGGLASWLALKETAPRGTTTPAAASDTQVTAPALTTV